MLVSQSGSRAVTAGHTYRQAPRYLRLSGQCRHSSVLSRAVAARKPGKHLGAKLPRPFACSATASETTSSAPLADMQVSIPELRQLCAEALQGLGYPFDHSRTITEVRLHVALVPQSMMSSQPCLRCSGTLVRTTA